MGMLGYRAEADEPETSGDPKRDVLILGAALFGLYFLLDLLSWFTERGGIFSIFSAAFSVHSRPSVINVDENGLRLVFLLIVWLAVFGFCRLFDMRIDMSSPAKSLLPILLIIGGGFILDGMFGEPIIMHYMIGHGYSRCAAGDWHQGTGKSRVWFANYVLESTDCREHQH